MTEWNTWSAPFLLVALFNLYMLECCQRLALRIYHEFMNITHSYCGYSAMIIHVTPTAMNMCHETQENVWKRTNIYFIPTQIYMGRNAFRPCETERMIWLKVIFFSFYVMLRDFHGRYERRQRTRPGRGGVKGNWKYFRRTIILMNRSKCNVWYILEGIE